MLLVVKKYRNEKKLSLRNLAILSGINYGYLSKIEQGKSDPGSHTIERIGHALKICPTVLVGGCSLGFCNEECVYYKDKYIEFSKLPIDGKLEVMYFFAKIKEKYKNYF